MDRTWWSPRLALNEEPVVDDSLNVGVEEASDVVTHLKVRDVDQGASRRAQRLLTQDFKKRKLIYTDTFVCVEIRNFSSSKDTIKKVTRWGFPGGPVVKNPPSKAGESACVLSHI